MVGRPTGVLYQGLFGRSGRVSHSEVLCLQAAMDIWITLPVEDRKEQGGANPTYELSGPG